MKSLAGAFFLVATLSLCLCCSKSASEPRLASLKAVPTSTVSFRVVGMTCASCQVTVRTALKKIDGVENARVSASECRATVDYEASKVTPAQLVDAVNKLGYQASMPAEGS